MDTSQEICVIEDNKPIRKLFCTILKKSGYETIEFADGSEALEWLKTNLPQAIIIDILLPDINGTDLHNIIREKPGGKKIPIIAVTGFAKANDRERYLQKGFDAYIAKPINTATFADEVIETIKTKNAG